MVMPAGQAQPETTTASQPQLDPSATQSVAPDPSPGLAKLRELAAHGVPDPAQVAELSRQYPAELHDIFAFLSTTFGTAYVQNVVDAGRAAQLNPAGTIVDPRDAGAAGKPGGQPRSTALPTAKTKNPADKLTPTAQELAFENAIAPPPEMLNASQPKDKPSLFSSNQASWDASARGARSMGGVAPLSPTPDGVEADTHVTNPDGTRQLAGTQQSSSRGITTTTNMAKTVAAPNALTGDEAAAELARYKKAVKDEIDARIAAVPKLPLRPTQEQQEANWEVLGNLKSAAAEAAEANDVNALVGIVVRNRLIVKPPERLIESTVTTRSQGVSAAGAVTGDSIFQDSSTTTHVVAQPNGTTTTTTHKDSASFGLGKGLDLSHSDDTTVVGPDGKPKKTSDKTSLTSGPTGPTQASASRTVINADGSSHAVAGNVQAGDGNLTVGGSGNLTSASGRSGSLSGQGGMVVDKDGAGLTGGLDHRNDLTGSKSVSAGGFATADGSVKVLVKENPDHTVTLTFTCAVKIKAGVHAGKRAPDEPVESGFDWAAGGSVGYTHARVVTRTKTASHEVLDKINQLKPFGIEAAATAYSMVFGQPIQNLCASVPVAGDGESVSVVSEDGVGVDAKGGMSGGENKDARTGGSVDGSFAHATLSGGSETNANGKLTRRVLTGGRTSYGGNASVSEGAASMKAGTSHSDEQRKTYLFEVDAHDKALVDAVRALTTAEDCEKFREAHKDAFRGVILGESESNGTSVGAGVGPVSADGGTTHATNGDVAETQHTVIGPDGKPKIVNDLSGTYTGSQTDNSSLSVAGIKVAQAQQTTTATGTVDPNGQTSLNLTTDSSDGNVLTGVPKNAKQIAGMRAADQKALVATNGLWGSVKKLAEDVGETSTIGAHFDPASFDALVARAGDQGSWMKTAQNAPKLWLNYRANWAHLGAALRSPQPPADWIAHDDSEGHAAAYQLARVKAFADFIAATGDAGQEAIQVLRGGYDSTDSALGIDVSFPPSMQPDRPNFDDACAKVEHLHANLDPFIAAGDANGGNAFLDALLEQLKGLHTKIDTAKDHASPAIAARASAGIGKMEQQVRTAKTRFATAVSSHDVHQLDVDQASAAQKQAHQQVAAASGQLHDTEGKQQAVMARGAAHETAMPKASDKAAMKKWEKEEDKLVAESDRLNQQNYEQSNAEAKAKEAEEEARKDAEKQAAIARVPGRLQDCLSAKNRTWGAVDGLYDAISNTFSGGNSTEKYQALCSVIAVWQQQWRSAQADFAAAGMPADGGRPDLRPTSANCNGAHLRAALGKGNSGEDGYIHDVLSKLDG